MNKKKKKRPGILFMLTALVLLVFSATGSGEIQRKPETLFAPTGKKAETQRPDSFSSPPMEPMKSLSPVQVMERYYAAIDARDVSRACYYRVSCSAKIKRMIRHCNGIWVNSARLIYIKGNRAKVYTYTTEQVDDEFCTDWKQYWYLQRIGGRWKIKSTSLISKDTFYCGD